MRAKKRVGKEIHALFLGSGSATRKVLEVKI